MLPGYYTAAAGMLTQERTLDVLTNNIVNHKTPGYQAERVVTTTFDYEYAIRKDAYGKTHIGSTSPIRLVEEIPVLLDSGLLQETLRPLDISLDGAGFFNIQDEEGEIYLTRNGGFDIDSEGYLYLKGSGRVMGKNGPLKVNTSDFTVTSDGTVYNAENQRIDQILVTWPGVDQIEKYSNGMYRAKEGAENADTPWADAKVAQGFLETSGLDVNREWVQVMEANRALQACSTALKTIDEMTQKAATTIAKL